MYEILGSLSPTRRQTQDPADGEADGDFVASSCILFFNLNVIFNFNLQANKSGILICFICAQIKHAVYLLTNKLCNAQTTNKTKLTFICKLKCK